MAFLEHIAVVLLTIGRDLGQGRYEGQVLMCVVLLSLSTEAAMAALTA